MSSNEEFELSDRQHEEIMGPIRAMGRLKTIHTRTLSPDFKNCPKKELERLLNRAKDSVLEADAPHSESQFKDIEQRINDRLESFEERKRFCKVFGVSIFALIVSIIALGISAYSLIVMLSAPGTTP